MKCCLLFITVTLSVFQGLATGADLEKVTTYPSHDFHPDVSGNNRYLAFVSDRSGNKDIWVKDLLSSRFSIPEQVTRHPAPDLSPALNRDGTKLLYVSKKSDPRGDIYLLDRLTGIEVKLTDMETGDSSPRWGRDENQIYYLKYDYRRKEKALFKYSLKSKREVRLFTESIHSFHVWGDGWIIYSDGKRVVAVHEARMEKKHPLTNGRFIDLSPSTADGASIFFTRYSEDTNSDGKVSREDSPSVWAITADPSSMKIRGLFQVTPDNRYFFSPAPAERYLYFSGGPERGITRVKTRNFFAPYSSYSSARLLADSYRERGDDEQALLVMGNISRNSIRPDEQKEWNEFNFEFIIRLLAAKKYNRALGILESLTALNDDGEALKEIFAIETRALKKMRNLSRYGKKRVASSTVEKILVKGEKYQNYVYGTALIEAGKLLFTVNELAAALDLFNRAEKVALQEIKARALFAKGKIYRKTGDHGSMTAIFVDIIRKFGPDSFWGRKAISDTLSISEKGDSLKERLLSLRELSNKYPVSHLQAASLLRQAELLTLAGENLNALERLNKLLKDHSNLTLWYEKALLKKADIFKEGENFLRASEVYDMLLSTISRDHPRRRELKRLKVLQMVREAYRKRRTGELKMAAKAFRIIITSYPDSVEGHRGYIESKVMLGKYDEVESYYKREFKERGDNPVFEYALGLTLTYSAPPKLKPAIRHLENALSKNQSVTYFHQTLGWAYEQYEKLERKRGYLEKAREEYMAALEINEALDFPDVEANMLLNIGNTWFSLDNFFEAFRFYQQRDSFREAFPSKTTEMLFRKNFGETCFKTGRSECAATQFIMAISLLEESRKSLPVKAELLERVALAFQDLEDHSKAVRYFSQALELVLRLGDKKNISLLQRNIGVNLYNMSLAPDGSEKSSLAEALNHYLEALVLLEKYGAKEQKRGKALVNIEIGLGEKASSYARGFDREGEEKLLFGYIANTYEKLSEPEGAIKYYLKKISRYPPLLSPRKNAALLSEKGVIHNRLGIIYYLTGQVPEAKKHLLSSLKICDSLALRRGMKVNILNLSRIYARALRKGEEPGAKEIRSLFKIAREYFMDRDGSDDDFYIFSNLAILAYKAYDPHKEPASTKLQGESSERLFNHYGFLADALYYYKKALAGIQRSKTISQGEKNNLLLLIKLNLLAIYQENGLKELAHKTKSEIDKNLLGGREQADWIYRFLQAGEAPLEERRELLKDAADSLLQTPLLAWERGKALRFIPLVTMLKTSLVKQLLEDNRVMEALSYADKLEKRILSSKLFYEAGEDIFFQGIKKEYVSELKTILKEMRESIKAGGGEKTDKLVSLFEETIFSLYDEAPSTVSLLYHYDLPVSNLSETITPNGSYVKIIELNQEFHLFFLHEKELSHYPLTLKNGRIKLPSRFLASLSPLMSLYLSVSSDILKKIPGEYFDKKIITRVNTFYTILDAKQKRNLFTSKGFGTEEFVLDSALIGQELSSTVKTVRQAVGEERETIKGGNFFIANLPLEGGVYRSEGKNGIHKNLPLSAINPINGHTAFLLNIPESEREQIPVSVESLVRTGFPHVVINNSPYDKNSAQKFVSLYLMYTADLPANEALAAAIEDLGGSGEPANFSLYGYSGMEEVEKNTLASNVYLKEVENAVAHFKNRNFTGALKGFENALWLSGIAKKEIDRPKLLTLMVESAFNSGDYHSAIKYQEKFLSLLPRNKSARRASAAYTLGTLYSRIEEYDKAVTLINEAIHFWKETDELDELAKAISNLGLVRENMGEYSKAFKEFMNSSDLFKEIGEEADVAGMYRKMGRINYLRRGSYEEARKSFRKANRIYTRLGDRKGMVETCFEIGFTYEKMGLFDSAVTFYLKGVDLAGKLNDKRLVSRGKLYLGNSHWFRGEYQEAFNYLSEATELAPKSDTALHIMIANTRGLIYWTLNEPQKALAHLNRAIKMARSEKMLTELATSLNNAGLIYRQRGNIEKSIEEFKKALIIDTDLKSKWGAGYDYRNLGISLMRSGKHGEAEKYLLLAEKISIEIKNRTNQVKSLLELGNLNLLLRKPDRASGYFKRAYEASLTYHLKEVSWRAAYKMGKIDLDKANHDIALEWLKRAVDIVESMRAGIRIEELRNSFQLNKLDLYREIILLLVNMGESDAAFNYLERSRSRSFIDLLGNRKIKIKNSEDQKKLDELNRLFVQIETISRELGTYITPPSKLLKRVEDAKNIYEESLIELKRTNPQLSTFVSVEPLKIEEFRELMDDTMGALSYMVTKDEVLIWLIKKKSTLFFRSRSKPNEVEKLVKRYRGLIQNLKPVDKELQRLYKILIQPAESGLKELKNLVIIPDSSLHYLSFAALKKGDHYLIDKIPLFYSPSASVLKFTFAKRKNNPVENLSVLAIGNPDLGNFNYDLPMAELEAASIKWDFPRVDLLTGKKATEKWVVSNIENYNIIHIASHGEFNSIDPLLSALLFASEEGERDNLTVQEIFSLSLKADIITLSACQTGLGKLEGGELIGLNRAFIYAGTHSLISSLWRVDDLSTALLMKYFYRNFTRFNKGSSLRKAQLLVKKYFPHPAHWAGFSLVGDYR